MILNNLSKLLLNQKKSELSTSKQTSKLILNFIKRNITIQTDFINNKTFMILNQIFIFMNKELINKKKYFKKFW